VLHLCREYGITPAQWRRQPKKDRIDMLADYQYRATARR
jgi:hypothetical protein